MAKPGPTPRIIRTPRDAEYAARDWLEYFGDRSPRVGAGWSDEGVDVESESTVAQVKAGDTPTGRPVIQQLYGIAALENKTAMAFSVAPFTTEAVGWAERANVALFQMDLTGGLRPVNSRARLILSASDGRLGGFQAVRAELEAWRTAGQPASITAMFELANGYRGFWGIWLDPGGVRVSTDFTGRATRHVATVAEAVDTIAGALRSVGGGYWDCQPVLTAGGNESRFRPRPSYPESQPDQETGEVARSGPTLPAGIRGGLRVTASDVYRFVAHPSCERRIHLAEKGMEGEPPGPLQMLLIQTGIQREETHLASLGTVTDLTEGDLQSRVEATVNAVRSGAAVIYQGALAATTRIGGHDVELIGVPDFLLRSGTGYIIRDTKTAVRVDDNERPDIGAQLRFYALLYRQTFGLDAVALEVVAGDGRLVQFPLEGPVDLDIAFQRIVEAKTSEETPVCLVKWSSQGTCPYFQRCWSEAVSKSHVVTIPGVPRELARQLTEQHAADVSSLLASFDERQLAEVRYRRGDRRVKVGTRADDILRAARALRDHTSIRHGPLELPDPPYVLFDLEGIPNFGSGAGSIYLWGTKVIARQESPYRAVFSQPGPNGDRTAWEEFLRAADEIFTTHGSTIPFVHWASYERTQLTNYIKRYGDQGGIARRVLGNLVDLLQVVRNGITLPVRSYSLKVVEEFVGFRRSQDEFGGGWSITIWQEAIESSSPDHRRQLLEDLATYNEEDLLGMQAVMRWLGEHT